MMRITAYADRLDDDLALVDWPNGTLTMQREWIGRSEGARSSRFAVGRERWRRRSRSSPPAPTRSWAARTSCSRPSTRSCRPSPPRSTRRRSTSTWPPRAAAERSRSRRGREEEDGSPHGRQRRSPPHRRVDPHLGRRLRHRRLRHRRGHGGACPRRARLRLRPHLRAPHRRGGEPGRRLARHARRGLRRATGVGVQSGELDGLATPAMKAARRAAAGGRGARRPAGHLQAARLGVLAAALLGRAHPHLLPRRDRRRPAARRRAHHPLRPAHRRRGVRAPAPRSPICRTTAPATTRPGPLARAVDWRFFQKDGRWFARETNTMPQWAGSCWYYLRFLDPGDDAEGWSEGGLRRVDAGRPLRRRRRARRAAPAVRALLAQGALRPRQGGAPRALPQAGPPGHDPGRDRVHHLRGRRAAPRRRPQRRRGGRRLPPQGDGRAALGGEARRVGRAEVRRVLRHQERACRPHRGARAQDVEVPRQRGQPGRHRERVRRRRAPPLRDVHGPARGGEALADRRRSRGSSASGTGSGRSRSGRRRRLSTRRPGACSTRPSRRSPATSRR